jgi:type IV pilus assembly protein PilB
MRDAETAQMGIQASLTGHLVFSTLHTNDAPGAITRMVDMGVPSYLVASSVIAVMAQRLVRVVCAKCKQPHQYSDEVLEEAGITPEMAAQATFMKGKGCSHCQGGGYRGRLGVYELMLITSKMRELVFENKATQILRQAAIAQGMDTLYMDAMRKVCKGITTIEEVYRVAKKTEQD